MGGSDHLRKPEDEFDLGVRVLLEGAGINAHLAGIALTRGSVRGVVGRLGAD